MANESKNLSLLLKNDYDDATLSLSVGSEVATMPLSNTQIYGNELRFVSTDIAEVEIVGDFNVITQVSSLVLHRHNLTAAATLTFKIYDSANKTGNVVYDSGELGLAVQIPWTEWDWRRKSLVSSILDDWDFKFNQLWFESTFGLSFSITIKDPSNPSGEIEITRVYLGDVFEPEWNFEWGQSLETQSNSSQVRTDGNSVYSKPSKTFRKTALQLNWLTDAERSRLYNTNNQVKTENDFFISLFPGMGNQLELESSFAAKYTKNPAFKHESLNRHSTTIELEEC